MNGFHTKGGDLFTYLQNQEFVNPTIDRWFVFILWWKWETLIVSPKTSLYYESDEAQDYMVMLWAQVTWTDHSISDKPTTICPPRQLSMRYASLYSWHNDGSEQWRPLYKQLLGWWELGGPPCNPEDRFSIKLNTTKCFLKKSYLTHQFETKWTSHGWRTLLTICVTLCGHMNVQFYHNDPTKRNTEGILLRCSDPQAVSACFHAS